MIKRESDDREETRWIVVPGATARADADPMMCLQCDLAATRSCLVCYCCRCGNASRLLEDQTISSEQLLECSACQSNHFASCTRFHMSCVEDHLAVSFALPCTACGAGLCVPVKKECEKVAAPTPHQIKVEDDATPMPRPSAKLPSSSSGDNLLLALLAADPRVPFSVLHHGALHFLRKQNQHDGSDLGNAVDLYENAPTAAATAHLIRDERTGEVRFNLPHYHVAPSDPFSYPPPLTPSILQAVGKITSLRLHRRTSSPSSSSVALLREALGPELVHALRHHKRLRESDVAVSADAASPVPKAMGRQDGRVRAMTSTGCMLQSPMAMLRQASQHRLSTSMEPQQKVS